MPNYYCLLCGDQGHGWRMCHLYPGQYPMPDPCFNCGYGAHHRATCQNQNNYDGFEHSQAALDQQYPECKGPPKYQGTLRSQGQCTQPLGQGDQQYSQQARIAGQGQETRHTGGQVKGGNLQSKQKQQPSLEYESVIQSQIYGDQINGDNSQSSFSYFSNHDW